MSKKLLAVVALCAFAIHASPHLHVLSWRNRVSYDRQLQEEDSKFVADPSANTDGNYMK